jgi:chromate transporter
VAIVEAGPLKLWTPAWATLDWRVVLIAGVSAILLLARHWSIPAVLAIASAIAVALHTAGL